MTHAAFILRILREQRDRIITSAEERAFWARLAAESARHAPRSRTKS